MIINRVRDRRVQLGLTQTQLAKFVGISKNALSSIEAQNGCSIKTALYLACALGCRLDDLFILTHNRFELDKSNV